MEFALVIFVIIEIIAIIYAIVGIGKYLFNRLIAKYNTILDRCATDL